MNEQRFNELVDHMSGRTPERTPAGDSTLDRAMLGRQPEPKRTSAYSEWLADLMTKDW